MVISLATRVLKRPEERQWLATSRRLLVEQHEKHGIAPLVSGEDTETTDYWKRRCRGVTAATIATQIAHGHAFEKHVLQEGQFPGILTREQFAHTIQRIMDHPSASKPLARGRMAYWDDVTGTVVIRDPRTGDGGTAFKPSTGRSYFEHLK